MHIKAKGTVDYINPAIYRKRIGSAGYFSMMDHFMIINNFLRFEHAYGESFLDHVQGRWDRLR